MQQDAPIFCKTRWAERSSFPGADHAIRWAMQPGTPASRNRASAASSSTHPRPLCGLPEKGIPFFGVSSRCLLFAVLAHAMRGQQ